MAKKDVLAVIDNETGVIPYNKTDVAKPVMKSNCKLCQAKFRAEAEAKFETFHGNYSALCNWLLKDKKMNISYPAVRNHIIYHYQCTEKQEYLLEYAEDVKKWVNHKENTMEAIKNRMAILDREMFFIAAEGDDLPIEERRKNAETVKRIADTLLSYEAKLADHDKALSPAKIVLNHLQIIVTDEIQNLKSDESRRVLTHVLERLNAEVGDMVIDQGPG